MKRKKCKISRVIGELKRQERDEEGGDIKSFFIAKSYKNYTVFLFKLCVIWAIRTIKIVFFN